MKKILATVFSFLFVLALTYIIASFAVWDINAGNWSDEYRGIISVVSVYVGLMVSVYVFMFYEDIFNKKDETKKS